MHFDVIVIGAGAAGLFCARTAGRRGRRVLLIATGGLSFPKLGATPLGHDLARQFGLKRVPPRPGLVPFTWAPEDREQFAGVHAMAAMGMGRGWALESDVWKKLT